MRVRHALALLALCLAPLAPPSRAMTIERKSLDWMSHRAQRIVDVRVVDSWTSMEEDNIWTTYRLEVLDVIAGDGIDVGERIELKLPGGVFGDLATDIPGMPQYDVGDEVVMFSRDYGLGWQSLVNGFQGSLPIDVRAEVGADGRTQVVRYSRAARGFYPGLGSDRIDEIKAAIRTALKPSSASSARGSNQ